MKETSKFTLNGKTINMALTTLQEFVDLVGAFESYLEEMSEEAKDDPETKPTEKILRVSTYYDMNGSVHHFDDNLDDAAYYYGTDNQWHPFRIKNSSLLWIAGTAYGEANYVQETYKAIPFVVFNRYRKQKGSGYTNDNKKNRHYYGSRWRIRHTVTDLRNGYNDKDQKADNAQYKAFMEASPLNRTANMKLAIQYTCRAALRDMHIYANEMDNASTNNSSSYQDEAHGAIGWHGNEFGYPNVKNAETHERYYLVGFLFANQAHERWTNLPSKNNKPNVGQAYLDWGLSDSEVASMTSTKKAAIKKQFELVEYVWESTFGAGSGGTNAKNGNASVFYKPNSAYADAHKHPLIIGDGKFADGVDEYGGTCAPPNNYVEP